MTSPPAVNLSEQSHGAARVHRQSTSRFRYTVVAVGLGAVAVLSARLLWMAKSGSKPDLDDALAYAAFLFVCGAAPFALAMLWRRHVGLAHALVERARPRRPSTVLVATVLSVGLASLALLVYLLARESVERSVQNRLEAIGALKASLTKAWVDDSSDDIRIWTSSPEFFRLIEEWRGHPPGDVLARERLIARLHEHSKTSQYIEIGLRDPATGALMLTTGSEEDSPEVRRAVLAAVASNHPVLDPMPWASRSDRGSPLDAGFIGTVQFPGSAGRVVVHVGIDAAHELFPMIELWPGNATAAEVLLLRRESASMTVLNGAIATDTGPVARYLDAQAPTSIGAALAAGGLGHLRGVDDRNQRVLAFAQAVEGTPWVVLAKLDRDEAFAELNRIVALAAVNGLGLLLLGAWWWLENRRQGAVERQYQLERTEQAVRLAELSRRVVAVQEDERRLLATELHDRTGGNLAAIDLNLKSIADRAALDRRADDDALLSETRELVADTTTSIREFCGELRPAALDYGGLAPALEHHLALFNRRTGIAVRFDHQGYVARFAPPIESVLFRIAQEALLNCAKHSRAGHVDVTLSSAVGQATLVIADDGVGFMPERVGLSGRGVGSGLLNMRERAAFAGGRLTIDSAPGHGTRITVQIDRTAGLVMDPAAP